MVDMPNNLERFQNFYLEIEKLISDSSKEDLAESVPKELREATLRARAEYQGLD